MTKRTHNFKGFDDFIEVFKAGTHTDSKGRTQTFTHHDLDQVVANFNADNPAPHVITHKEMYSPFAYAQTTEVKRDGDSLYVKADKVEPQFEKLVEDGRLFERSIRLVPSEAGWKLGHVAWLGAEPPAVEGLAPVQFESGETFLDFAFQDSYTPYILSRMMRRIRDYFIEKEGLEVADTFINDHDINNLSEHAKDLRDEDKPVSSFSKPNTDTGDEPMSEFTKAQLDEAVATAEAKARKDAETEFAQQKKESDAKLTAETNKRLSAEFSKDILEMVDAGTLLPAQTEGMSEFMLRLSDADDAHFEFSAGEEGKEETIKTSPLKWFKEFTQSIGQQIDTGESTAGESGGVDGDDAQAIADAALQYQKEQADKGTDISASQAVAHVKKQNQ